MQNVRHTRKELETWSWGRLVDALLNTEEIIAEQQDEISRLDKQLSRSVPAGSRALGVSV